MNLIFPQTSRDSFLAVSTPIFESKYSLESSRRDLQNALLCTGLESNPQKAGKPCGGVLVGDVLVESVWVKKYTKINIEKMKSGKS